ncbi:MAG: Mur ligase family protein [Tissierellia bacterium]|nr:Mur ligase family protein [Tissierellia bacterium]
MKLQELLRGVKMIETRGELSLDMDIPQVIHDTRELESGGLFVAMVGALVDGHKFVPRAQELGAAVAVVEEFQEVDLPQIRVENSRIALAELAGNFYGHPSKEMKIVGITATNGKTSTSYMLEAILQEAGWNTGVIGTVDVRYGDVAIPSILTTPESVVLQKHLRDMKNAGVEVVVMEVSSSAGENHRVHGMDFDLMSFHNLSKEHIEQHGSFEAYFEAKSRFIRDAKEEAVVFLSSEDPKIWSLKEETNAQVVAIGENGAIDARDKDVSTGYGHFTYVVADELQLKDQLWKRESFPISLSVAGFHSIANATVAISLAKALGVENEQIQRALDSFGGVERRFEMIYDREFKIMDDHFANVRNIEITMKTLEKMDYKNLHILYAIRGSRGAELNRENAQELLHWMDKLKPQTVLATRSTDVVGSKDVVTDDEFRAFQEVMAEGEMPVPVLDQLEDGVEQILSKGSDGDIILLAGCQGMDSGARFAWKRLMVGADDELKKNLEDKINHRIC